MGSKVDGVLRIRFIAFFEITRGIFDYNKEMNKRSTPG
jgi:hypothetical protein